MPAGFFITFEGGEGGGKSTQARRLAEWLQAQGREVIQTREPGGTPGAEKIRALLVSGEENWESKTELFLFAASRHEHCEKVIKPALAAGKVVVCDRFNESTLAYQGYGRQQNLGVLNSVLNVAIGDLRPDLTIVLDLPAELALSRSKGGTVGEDRFEKAGMDFHTRLRQGFLELAKDSPRFAVIDATQTIDAVFNEIILLLQQRLSAVAV